MKSLYVFAHPKFQLDPNYDVMVVADSADEAREVFAKETLGPEMVSEYKIIAYCRLNRSKVIDIGNIIKIKDVLDHIVKDPYLTSWVKEKK